MLPKRRRDWGFAFLSYRWPQAQPLVKERHRSSRGREDFEPPFYPALPRGRARHLLGEQAALHLECSRPQRVGQPNGSWPPNRGGLSPLLLFLPCSSSLLVPAPSVSGFNSVIWQRNSRLLLFFCLLFSDVES